LWSNKNNTITRLKARVEEVKLGEQTTGNIYGSPVFAYEFKRIHKIYFIVY